MEAWERIQGAKEFVEWFGCWPDFHDAEILHLHLNRDETSSLLIYTCEMTSEVLPTGHYGSRKHVDVEFLLEGIENLEIAEFNHQNVIFGLSVASVANGLRISMEGCYGMAGHLEATSIALRFSPHRNGERNHSASRNK